MTNTIDQQDNSLENKVDLEDNTYTGKNMEIYMKYKRNVYIINLSGGTNRFYSFFAP